MTKLLDPPLYSHCPLCWHRMDYDYLGEFCPNLDCEFINSEISSNLLDKYKWIQSVGFKQINVPLVRQTYPEL